MGSTRTKSGDLGSVESRRSLRIKASSTFNQPTTDSEESYKNKSHSTGCKSSNGCDSTGTGTGSATCQDPSSKNELQSVATSSLSHGCGCGCGEAGDDYTLRILDSSVGTGNTEDHRPSLPQLPIKFPRKKLVHQ